MRQPIQDKKEEDPIMGEKLRIKRGLKRRTLSFTRKSYSAKIAERQADIESIQGRDYDYTGLRLVRNKR